MSNTLITILFIIMLYLLYQVSCLKKSIKENMANITNTTHTTNVDYEAIKNLGIIAKGLMNGGYRVPGNLIIDGKLTANSFGNISTPNISVTTLNSNNIKNKSNITTSKLNNKQPLYVNNEVGISMNRGRNAGTYMGINDNQGFYATGNICGGGKPNLMLKIERPSCF